MENAAAQAATGYAEWGFWLAAGLALALLFLVNVVAQAMLSRGSDVVMRLFRLGVYLILPLLAIVPALLMLASRMGQGVGLGLLFYVVFFGLFCYYLGKRVGTELGRKHISDLVGLDSPDNIEDAQDRLFESRMRYPVRADVVKSIGEMAKRREAERLEVEKRSVRSGGPAERPERGNTAVITEVQVEDVDGWIEETTDERQ